MAELLRRRQRLPAAFERLVGISQDPEDVRQPGPGVHADVEGVEGGEERAPLGIRLALVEEDRLLEVRLGSGPARSPRRRRWPRG